jgi:hypothetical protein
MLSKCGWCKSKCVAKLWLCVLDCGSFDFAEAFSFRLSFFCLLSVVSVFLGFHPTVSGLAKVAIFSIPHVRD